jgi:hypothetical protein
MKIAIVTNVRKNVDHKRLEEFIFSLSKTSYPYFLTIVNSSDLRIADIVERHGIEDYRLIQNGLDVNPVTCINQGLFSCLNSHDYSIYINSINSLIVDEKWLEDTVRYFNEDFGIGGDVFPLRITNSPEIIKIIQSVSEDISWIQKHVNRYMMVNCADSNIFMVNNRNLIKVGFPSMNSCDDNSYATELSLKFLANDFNVVDISEVKSSSKDDLRFDIGSAIKSGKKIVCPVVSSTVRKRIIECNM